MLHLFALLYFCNLWQLGAVRGYDNPNQHLQQNLQMDKLLNVDQTVMEQMTHGEYIVMLDYAQFDGIQAKALLVHGTQIG